MATWHVDPVTIRETWSEELFSEMGKAMVRRFEKQHKAQVDAAKNAGSDTGGEHNAKSFCDAVGVGN